MTQHTTMNDQLSNSQKERRYMSYLLRLWQIQSGGRMVWRASLESAGTGERQGFAGLEDLFGFLQEQTSVMPDEMETRARASEGDDAP